MNEENFRIIPVVVARVHLYKVEEKRTFLRFFHIWVFVDYTYNLNEANAVITHLTTPIKKG